MIKIIITNETIFGNFVSKFDGREKGQFGNRVEKSTCCARKNSSYLPKVHIKLIKSAIWFQI